MNPTDDQLTRLFERSFPEQSPGDELWETTRASMRRKVRARRAMVLASLLLVVAAAAAVPQVLLAQRSSNDVEFVDTPPEGQMDSEPDVPYTEKPFHLAPNPRRDRDEEGQARQGEAAEPSPAGPRQPEDAPAPTPTPTTAPAEQPPPPSDSEREPEPDPAPSQPPAEPPITFTSHRSGDRVPVCDVTVAGESCTYEAMVELTLVAPDGTRTTTHILSTDACRGRWQHTFALTGPGEWTVIATAPDGSGGEYGPPYQTSLTLVAF